MSRQGVKNYFTEFWNWMDVIVLLISLLCIAFNVYRTITVEKLLESLLSTPNQFADFEQLSFWQMQFNYGVALTVFFAWIKVRIFHS